MDYLRAVAYGSGTFVVTGGRATLTSTDGTNWVAHNFFTNGWPSSIAYGNGQFVAVGGTIFASPDGIHWTQQSGGTFGSFESVEFINGQFIAFTSNGLAVSSDGITWTNGAVGTGVSFEMVAYGNRTFVRGTDAGEILTSTDGVTWTSRYSSATAPIYGLTFGDGQFVAVGGGNLVWLAPPVILTSPDGIEWASRTSGPTSSLFGVVYGNGQFVTVGSGGTILNSTDVVNWAQQNSGTTNELYAVAYGQGGFAAVGGSGAFLTSSNGIAWTAQDVGATNQFSRVAAGGGHFVAISQDATIASWPDGKTWSLRSLATNFYLYDVAYGNGRFVAFGEGLATNKDYHAVLTSSDGRDWSAAFSFGGPIGLPQLITYGDGHFELLTDYEMATTTDGIVWVTNCCFEAYNSFAQRYEVHTPSALTYGNGEYVVVAPDIRPVGSDLSEVVSVWCLNSLDGFHWVEHLLPTLNVSSVAYGNGRFVAVGAYGAILESGRVLHLSPIRPLPGGVAEGTIAGAAGTNCVIQTSTDLLDWLPLTNITTDANGSAQFSDLTSTNFTRRFYRAVLP